MRFWSNWIPGHWCGHNLLWIWEWYNTSSYSRCQFGQFFLTIFWRFFWRLFWRLLWHYFCRFLWQHFWSNLILGHCCGHNLLWIREWYRQFGHFFFDDFLMSFFDDFFDDFLMIFFDDFYETIFVFFDLPNSILGNWCGHNLLWIWEWYSTSYM